MPGLDELKVNELPDPRTLEGFDRLDPLQRLAAENIHRALMACSTFGVISDEQLKGHILDFGCGGGGSTWYLSKLSGDVRAVDIDPRGLKELNCIPETNITTGDGIQLMNTLPESSLDIVTATMLGPDTSGGLVKPFLEAARRVIKKDGWIVIFSEIGTLSTVKRVTGGKGIVEIDNNTLLAAKVAQASMDIHNSFDFSDLGFGKKIISPFITGDAKPYFGDFHLGDLGIDPDKKTGGFNFSALLDALKKDKPGGLGEE